MTRVQYPIVFSGWQPNEYIEFDTHVEEDNPATAQNTDSYMTIQNDASTDEHRAVIKYTIPDINTDLEIAKVEVDIHTTGGGAGNTRMNLYGGLVKGAVAATLTWNKLESGGSDWQNAGGDFDEDTDFGFGADGIISYTNDPGGGSTTYTHVTIDITEYIKKQNLSWGSSFLIWYAVDDPTKTFTARITAEDSATGNRDRSFLRIYVDAKKPEKITTLATSFELPNIVKLSYDSQNDSSNAFFILQRAHDIGFNTGVIDLTYVSDTGAELSDETLKRDYTYYYRLLQADNESNELSTELYCRLNGALTLSTTDLAFTTTDWTGGAGSGFDKPGIADIFKIDDELFFQVDTYVTATPTVLRGYLGSPIQTHADDSLVRTLTGSPSASTTLNATITTTTETSITVLNGSEIYEGTVFFVAGGTSGDGEIMYCKSRVGTAVVVVRGYNGSTATTFTAGPGSYEDVFIIGTLQSDVTSNIPSILFPEISQENKDQKSYPLSRAYENPATTVLSDISKPDGAGESLFAASGNFLYLGFAKRPSSLMYEIETTTVTGTASEVTLRYDYSLGGGYWGILDVWDTIEFQGSDGDFGRMFFDKPNNWRKSNEYSPTNVFATKTGYYWMRIECEYGGAWVTAPDVTFHHVVNNSTFFTLSAEDYVKKFYIDFDDGEGHDVYFANPLTVSASDGLFTQDSQTKTSDSIPHLYTRSGKKYPIISSQTEAGVRGLSITQSNHDGDDDLHDIPDNVETDPNFMSAVEVQDAPPIVQFDAPGTVDISTLFTLNGNGSYDVNGKSISAMFFDDGSSASWQGKDTKTKYEVPSSVHPSAGYVLTRAVARNTDSMNSSIIGVESTASPNMAQLRPEYFYSTYTLDDSGTTYVDKTTESSGAHGTEFAALTDVDDALFIGCHRKCNRVFVDFKATPNSSFEFEIYYSLASTGGGGGVGWGTLYSSSSNDFNFTDKTSGLQENGYFEFDAPNLWVKADAAGVSHEANSGMDFHELYWLKVKTTVDGGSPEIYSILPADNSHSRIIKINTPYPSDIGFTYLPESVSYTESVPMQTDETLDGVYISPGNMGSVTLSMNSKEDSDMTDLANLQLHLRQKDFVFMNVMRDDGKYDVYSGWVSDVSPARAGAQITRFSATMNCTHVERALSSERTSYNATTWAAVDRLGSE